MKRKIIFILFCFIFVFPCFAQQNNTLLIYLRSNSQKDTMWDGVSFPIYAMTRSLGEHGRIPAKTIYCNEGDTVTLHAYNISQGEHHTIHLHGLDVDTRNDGDPMTSFSLNHKEDSTYTFVATHAGTYFYHCHVADIVHLQMGMYGFIIVKAKNGVKTCWTNGPLYSKYYNWLMSEVDKSWHLNIPVHDTITNTVMVPKYNPDYFLINGKSETELAKDDSIKITASQYEPIYLRLGNMGFTDNEIIFPHSLQAKLIDSDGRPLPTAIYMDTVEVSPGETYGVLIYPNAQETGNIKVNYINLNSHVLLKTELVPYSISGNFGVNNISKNESLRVYPNPAKDMIGVDIPASNQYRLRIYNVQGIALIQAMNSSEINVQNLTAGIYIVELITGNEIKRARFIKQ